MSSKMGRPTIDINKDQFENLCALQCTEIEIAGFFKCSIDTINNWCKKEYEETFSEVYKKKSVVGKISLRRYQFKLAEHNPTMSVWLGKQWLNQTDRTNINIGNEEESKKLMEQFLENFKDGESEKK